MTKQVLDHTRGLCQKPDVVLNTPQEVVEKEPAHCQCCGSKMRVVEMSLSFQRLGMYQLICDTCPDPETEEVTARDRYRVSHLVDNKECALMLVVGKMAALVRNTAYGASFQDGGKEFFELFETAKEIHYAKDADEFLRATTDLSL